MTRNHPPLSRRNLLAGAGGGFGLTALQHLLASEVAAAAPDRSAQPFAVRAPHHTPRAKRCIFLYMPGGPSQVDLFDPKPRVSAENGKPLPFEKPKLERTKTGNLLASPWKFSPHGQSGIEVSQLLPHLASRVDELCVIRSMVADNINHTGAALQMNTGEQAFSRPSMGSWLLYGLGAENQNLPAFVVVSPAAVFQGAQLWASSFLPSAYQGTLVRDMQSPIANLRVPSDDFKRQRNKLDALRQLNEIHKQKRVINSQLDARIATFELAFRMQQEAPAAFDLSRESKTTHQAYGTGDPTTELFGRQCLLARRLVERGVRYVQLFDAPVNNAWDHHGGLREKLPSRCAAVDQPIAALISDLKARGLLEDTLVLWGGEFGRTPTAEGTNGREHHPFGFTMWLAGGGIRGGHVHGATDEYGWHATHDKVHVHDLHATILHLMGLDHKRLTYHYSGRDYRLTDVAGQVVQNILA
ncbi:MAG: sulfatase [Planctomycetaceae bacterium]|nr:sulfatase [Planctomycetaceae bacterium]